MVILTYSLVGAFQVCYSEIMFLNIPPFQGAMGFCIKEKVILNFDKPYQVILVINNNAYVMNFQQTCLGFTMYSMNQC